MQREDRARSLGLTTWLMLVNRLRLITCSLPLGTQTSSHPGTTLPPPNGHVLHLTATCSTLHLRTETARGLHSNLTTHQMAF